jgi:F-type H+-transporting ATPase subunit b
MSLISLIAEVDPTQTHSWLLPETSEIIYGGISSTIVFLLLVKFAFPLAKKALQGRTEKIAKEMSDAEQMRADADTEAGDIRRAVGDISNERARLMAEAEAQSEVLLREGRGRITTEVAELEAKAAADLVAAASRIGDELRGEIARLSSTTIDKVVRATLDDKAHQDLVESFINSVGASR